MHARREAPVIVPAKDVSPTSTRARTCEGPRDDANVADGDAGNRRVRAGTWGLAVAVVLTTAVAATALVRWVAALVAHRSQGLDPSDEALYLIAARDPDAAVARPSNFGHYLHLLLRLTGGSLGWFRVAGLAVLVAGTTVAWWGVTRWIPKPVALPVRRLVLVAVWVCLSAVALTHYTLWLVTPGYNLLALTFAMTAFGGTLAGLRTTTSGHGPAPLWPPNGGFLVLGFSAIMLAEVRATAGVGVGVVALTMLIVVGGSRSALSSASSVALGLAAGLIVTMIVVGSPITTLTAVSRYSHMTAIGRMYRPADVWEARFLRASVVPWLVRLMIVALVIAVVWRGITSLRVRTAVMTVSTITTAAVLWGDHARGGSGALASGAGWWWLRMTGWALLFLTALAPRASRTLAIGPLILLGALGTTIGSNNGVVHQTALTAGLFALAIVSQAVIVAFSCRWESARILPAVVFMLIAGLVSFGQLSASLADPYRLAGPISANDTDVSLGSLGTVQVTEAMARYLAELHMISPLVPDDARDCLVDLSGGTPLTAIALGSRSATNPWVLGGYPGSAAALDYLLTFAPCITGRVLVVDAPNGDRRIPLPDALRGRTSRVLGEARFQGYLQELQVVSVFASLDGDV